ncbi:putative repeat protein (TIGR01451 family) [Microbacterium phyllosphaerae]|uniref:Repeat protein (TIGR01451 family) n=1 Tax=Microbacterium phyllosphaerae TaxID=124798 RepID=A0ABS4WUE2_9MICO|nr:DUF11 domain-containing protein [Microbacterium phyllosphaerae]MBP2379821.1 putative repeat protein (TIGR01451 family) [Microbacterium phyllosphaerae]
MAAHAHSSIRRTIAGATAALLIAVGLTVVTETVAPTPASAAQNPTQCAGSLSLDNGSFEQPVFASGVIIADEALVPGWFTTATDNQIELWRSPGNPRNYPAGQGSQFAELNATQASTLYQDVATTPGQTLYWSLKHRGREGNDTMRVVIGVPGSTLTNVSGSLTDGTAAWGTHTGSYTVPAGQTTTRFGFQAVSSATGNASVGNLLDDIAFGTGPCLISTKSVANLTRGGTSAEIGDTLRYTVTTRNDGGNPALQSVSTDVLPAGIDFVPGSIRIVSGPGAGTLTDATGDDRGEYTSGNRTLRVRLGDGGTATAGGSVGVDAVTSYTFDAKVRTEAAGTTIVNEARVAFREPVTNIDRTSTTQEALTPVNQAADLAITKTLDTSPLVAGQPVTFTIGVTNNGPQTATGVTVTDAVPAGLTAVQATPSGGSCTVGATISCALPDLAVGAGATITVTGTVSPSFEPGAALTNTASVSGTRFDVNLANNTATASGSLTAISDVSVTKSFFPAVPVAGQNVTYTLITRNDGPSEARDVRLTDPLDPETAFVSVLSDQGTCTVASGIVDCAIGTLAPGAVVTTTIVVEIDADAAAVVQNSASVTSSTPDSDPTNNVDSTSFQPDIIADLAVTKTASAAQVAAGDTVDFTLAVSNLGDSDAVNAVLDDTLPAGFTVTGVTGPAGSDCSFTAGSIRCTWADLVVGGPVDVVVSTVVDSDAPVGVSTNTASIASPADDVNTANNSDSVDVEIVQSADLSIQKSAPATGTPGSAFTYTLVVTNDGPSVARGATLADTLPAGFTATSVDDAGCSIGAGAVTCSVGDLAPGDSVTVNVTGTWAATASGTIRNTATTTSATPDPSTANNTSSVDVALTPSADVSVVKTTSTPSIPLRGEASFVITVRNDGPSAAAGVVVTEVAPAGLEVTSAAPSAGTWSPADHQWTVGTLLPGESATLAVTATATVVGTLTNTATATSPTPDPDPSDNTGTSTVIVTPSADLSIVKTSSVNPAPVNGSITYTIVVTNGGPSPASAVAIADSLPAGLLNPTTPTAGCSITAAQLDCAVGALAVGATFTATVSGTVDPAIASAALSNTATVTSTTPDPDPSDNSSTVEVPVSGTPRVELVKTAGAPVDANGNGRTDVGDTVAYTFTVRNTGDVTLTSAAITDPLLGGAVACAAFGAPLAPGASVTCAPVDYVLTQQDIDEGTVHNEASVTAESALGTATDGAEADVIVPAVNSVVLTKVPSLVDDADSSSDVTAGDTIAYTFTVTNTGTTTLTDAQISDPMLGGPVVCAALAGASLAPGASVTCAPVDYTLTQGDIDEGIVRNTASVTADAPVGTVTDTASASADIERTAGIDLQKNVGQVQDANGDGFIGAGDTVQYSFTVRNTGNTTLDDVEITDPLLGDDALCAVDELAVGAANDCGPFTYTLTQADIENGSRPNTATATGTGPLGAVRDDASAEIVFVGTPGISLTKTPGEPVDANDDGMIGAGDTIAYSFRIRNTGTTVLTDIVLDDPLLGGIVDCPALDGLALVPTDVVDCGPVEYLLTQDDVDAGIVRNTATVTGQSVAGSAESADDADVTVIGTDALTLLKSAAAVVDANGNGRTDAGDTIAYTFTVTNSGTTRLTDVAVSDPRLDGDVVCDTTDLAPGDSALCTGPAAVITQAEIDAGQIVNTATATGTGTGDVPPSAEDTVTTPLEVQPAIALAKTGGEYADVNGNGKVDAGDTVQFRFTVTNTGARTLTAIAIDDPKLGATLACEIADLAPGDTAACGPIGYTLTTADVASGKVVNVATVSGAAGTVVVTAAATATVDLDVLAVTGGVITGLGWALALLAVGALVLFVSRVRRRETEHSLTD